MAGKYAKVVNALPKLAGEEPAYQDKVTVVKLAMIAEPEYKPGASAMAKAYAAVRAEKARIEEQLSECNLRLTAIEQLLVDQYELEDTASVRLDTGESISVQVEPYAQVQDREAFRQWCVAEGLEKLMSIPWTTANSLTKQRLVDGLPEPPGVTVFAKNKIVLRK
jgi:hypothetical protein